jgi:hypothetical protein
MYKFKLKEIEIGDTAIRGGKKSTVSAIDDTTGRIEWDIVDAADFSSVYKALLKAKDFLSTLEKEGKAKDDVIIDGFAEDIAKLFNAFRTHVRKEYPKEYERVSRLKEEEIDEQSSTATGGDAFAGGEGAQYATPFAFSKKKNNNGTRSIYYYKLGYKPVPKIKPKSYDIKKLFEYNDFQENRISAFDEVERKINSILPMLSNAKNKTAEYYNENPGSYTIIFPTDAMLKELDDIIEQIKQANEDANRTV